MTSCFALVCFRTHLEQNISWSLLQKNLTFLFLWVSQYWMPPSLVPPGVAPPELEFI